MFPRKKLKKKHVDWLAALVTDCSIELPNSRCRLLSICSSTKETEGKI